MSITIWTPDLVDQAYERCANDFGRFSWTILHPVLLEGHT